MTKGSGSTAAVGAKCWICGGPADSGEHKSKKSDLKAVFASVSQKAPLRMHTVGRENRPIGSFDASPLKWQKSLCHACNTTLTQPHDVAWEVVSDWLRNRVPPIAPRMVVRATEAFPCNTRALLLDMHLFWVKALGCYLAESGAVIDLTTFATALQNGKAQPDIYLQFGQGELLGGQLQVRFDEVLQKEANGSVTGALGAWTIGTIAVRVFYLRGGKPIRDGMHWHPRMNTCRLVIADFKSGVQQG